MGFVYLFNVFYLIFLSIFLFLYFTFSNMKKELIKNIEEDSIQALKYYPKNEKFVIDIDKYQNQIKELNLTYLPKKVINKEIVYNDIYNGFFIYYKPDLAHNKINIIKYNLSKRSLKIVDTLKYCNEIFDFLFYLLTLLEIIIIAFSFLYYKKNKGLVKNNEVLKERISQEIQKNIEKERQLLYKTGLARMGEMLGIIAHQWKQPLATMSTLAISIKIDSKLGEIDSKKLSDKMDIILNYTQYLSNTIDDFKNFFKPKKEKELVRYHDIMNSVLKIIELDLQNKDINLNLNIEYKKKLCVFSNELRQVILNLIKNAEDVLVEKDIPQKEINIHIYEADSNIVFEIEDNGGGIDEKILDKIFEPYFTTKGENGTGLGLYISKIIIEEHLGGSLVVYNSNKGAVFKIILKEENC